MYEYEVLEEARTQLRKLDRSIARRIVQKIKWLAENFDQIEPDALAHNLADLYKLRIGNYRVIYEIVEEEQLLVVLEVGHRRDIYD